MIRHLTTTTLLSAAMLMGCGDTSITTQPTGGTGGGAGIGGAGGTETGGAGGTNTGGDGGTSGSVGGGASGTGGMECVCTSGPCCKDGCNVYQAGDEYVCQAEDRTECDTGSCGAEILQRTWSRLCTGDTSECTGAWQPGADTRLDKTCSAGLCANAGTDYECVTCQFGCGNGGCWPECNPATACCDAEGHSTGACKEGDVLPGCLNTPNASATCDNCYWGECACSGGRWIVLVAGTADCAQDGSGVAKDMLSGLTWTQNNQSQSWQTAWAICEGMGMRLPTMTEWQGAGPSVCAFCECGGWTDRTSSVAGHHDMLRDCATGEIAAVPDGEVHSFRCVKN